MSAKPHAFVVMPYGQKPGPDGELIDFNRIYTEYIEPAIIDAGLVSFRGDQDQRAGDIRPDMFQELLIADLVVADVSIDNPNAWYELGVRHALRSRGVVLISGGRVTAAFDIYTDKKLCYGLEKGAPDPATLEADKAALTGMIKATMESWHGRKISPVYDLLPNLQEPDWKSLKIGRVREFWELHEDWEQRLELARRAGRIGNLLVLADEAPIAAFRAEAWIKAGAALRRSQQFAFALEYLERGLEIEPNNLTALQEKGICLQRLALSATAGHSLDRAREHYKNVLEKYPNDAETWALLGRVDKDAWTESWRLTDSDNEQMREDAGYEDALLRASIDSYSEGYRADPSHYYSGINALTLMELYRHLTDNDRYKDESDVMSGAVRYAAMHETDEYSLFWSKATLGDLEVLVGTPTTIKTAYKEAVAKNDKDWFALDSARAQLILLQDLGFRPEAVEAGIEVFDRALKRLSRPRGDWQPRQILLFSGHMVDAPDRAEPRFPLDKEQIARDAISAALEELDAGADDLAISQAAAGGDLLFLEACQERDVRCEVMLPFDEPEFIQRSILPSDGGDVWRKRFYAVKSGLDREPRIMPAELGSLPAGANPFVRCNLWLLYTALATGTDKVRFVALWNGEGGDGPGGTANMYKEVERRTGRVTWLNTRTLF